MKMVALGDVIAPSAVRRAGNNSYPLLSMTMHGGLVDQSQKFKKRVASENVSDYKVVDRGQLVVGFPIDEGVLDFQNLYDAGIVSPAYGIWDLKDSAGVDRRYLKLFLRSPRAMAYYKSKLRGSTARRRSLPSEVFLALAVPLPHVEQQRRTAAILDHANALNTKRRQVGSKHSQLTQSIFENTFGDGLRNTDATLDEVADVSSGITHGRKTVEATRPIPYLAVANVQDGQLALGHVKEIDATDSEVKRYALAYGDLVLTEGGDPDKLGRGTVWRAELPVCLHQNHIFRVRVAQDRLEPEYLSAYLASRPAKYYFLRAAKQTTGIASINMTQLRRTPVCVPPLEDQRAYIRRVHRVVGVQRYSEAQATDLDKLFASLQFRAFSGQL